MNDEKLVIVAGTTGAGLREVSEKISSDNDCVFHFEDMVLEPYRLGDCNDIEQLASMTLVSKDEARKAFQAGLERIRARAGRGGCKKLVVFAHLSYLTQRMIVTNPVLGDLLGLAREADVIYLVEDYYDVLDVVSRRPSGCGPSYRIDPILLLQWRAVDSNLLTSIESVKPGTRTLILGVKHPWETFIRLLDTLLLTRAESLRAESVRTAYVSHPISTIRSMHVSLGYESLQSMVMVQAIEAVKQALRVQEGLVLYEPTSVDELFADPYENVYEALRIPLEEALLKSLENAPVDLSIPDPQEVGEKITVYHSLFVGPHNRWPFPATSIRRVVGGLSYTHSSSLLSLLDPRYTKLYGVDYYLSMFLDLITTTRLSMSRKPREASLGGMMQGQVIDLVKSQIEMRDYQYVGQSNMIVAVTTPVVIDSSGDEAGVYVPVSTGMEAELHRAKALSKPVTVILLPLTVEAAAAGVGDGDVREVARAIAGGRGWRKCSESPGRHGVLECLEKIVEGGLFGPARGASRGCVLDTVTASAGSIERLARDYALGLGSCGVPRRSSTSSGYFSIV